jgi:DNA repair photolyase
MTFYEIQAKSIISRVPAASRVPFDWTINPYRGCSHACVYCQVGDTPILMSDGRTKPLAEVRVGDELLGTVRVGGRRRYTATRVLAHWSTTKPAWRVRLTDGTELTASADHRYLTDRGWSYVAASHAVGGPRRVLVPAARLMGTGTFAEGPKDTADYRIGYLNGLIVADRPSGTPAEQVLARARIYLAGFDGPDDEPWPPAQWPAVPSHEWCKGFLAGIFDTDGSGAGGIRISNSDAQIRSWIHAALTTLGFRPTVRSSTVGVVGGFAEQLRFHHTVDPADTRKRVIAGVTVESSAGLDVESVRPLGFELPMYDITTGTGDFIANGVVSHNCFARNTHTYLDLDAGLDFNTKVVVKVNAPQLLRKELSAPKWTGAHIAMGTNVDCYQRAEGRYGLMRGIIEALRDFANPFSILTKGTLITRDLDLLKQAAEVTNVGVSFSVGFIDDDVWRSAEPGTPSPLRRLDAVRRFSDAGFAVHVLMAPILPGITDTDESIEATVAAIAASGAAGISPISLHLRPGAREWYAAWLGRTHPELVDRYRSLFGNGSYSPKAYQREVSARVGLAARRHGLGQAHMTEHRGVEPSPSPAPPPEQLTLL